jgi:hypothetical protein
MVSSAVAFMSWAGSTATAVAPYVGMATATSEHIQGNIDRADKANMRAKEEEQIGIAKDKALTQRKQMIDKQRVQLLGAGDGKYTTNRTVGVTRIPKAGDMETLG